MKSTVLCIGL